MKFLKQKHIAGFTLMEVNLAIFIMAVGLLAMVALYPLAYRESQQSKDDVKGAAVADCILNTLTAALSSRNISWDDWKSRVTSAVGHTPSKDDGGWMVYCDSKGGSYVPKKKSEINGTARNVYSSLMRGERVDFRDVVDGNEFACAIVAQWGTFPWIVGRTPKDLSRVVISLRISRRAGELMAQPIYYTEIHFQGDQYPNDPGLQAEINREE